jgi:hypothetical protein
MGEGRRRKVDSDELLHGERGGGGRTVARDGGSGNLSDHVLGLQRDYGNAAVTTVVQRTPKSKAASTDAPWIKKKAPKPSKVSKEPVIEDLRPKTGSKEYTTSLWPSERLEGWIKDHGATAKGQTAKDIARMYEELYYRKPNWMMGLNISRAWKAGGDDKRAKFWMDYFNSKGKLLDPKPESMEGKEF